MNFKDSVSLEDIKKIINSSLSDFYTYDAILLDYATENKAVSERCMVFHIGWYMIKKIKKISKLEKANVDCEYNRNFCHPKGMYAEVEKGIRNKIQDMVPDLLVHQRGSNQDNLLVIEFKKGNPDRCDKNNDIRKLEYFTNPDNEYKYKYGFYIELHKEMNAKIEVYQKGKVMGSICYTWQLK